ncbi:MAG: SIS domain-containing protein [Candidatus Eremiobacteraeota bacterium]|nr:SIS domain-containing protein [Candidatus Eremiobacteraeota bacterium]
MLKLDDRIAEGVAERKAVSRAFFPAQAPTLAHACRLMAERFLRGGRLLAFGRGPYATDAQHVSVEFQHPVLVGKRALPALDLSAAFRDWIPAITCENDMVVGFAPPSGDPDVTQTLADARRRGAMTFAMPGEDADYGFAAPSDDEHVNQEMVEILCHTLYENVHVFFEHRERGHDDVGASSFLYPYLGSAQQSLDALERDVAASIVDKASDAERLRDELVLNASQQIAEVTHVIGQRLDAGGRLLLFGNGGSATDANDWALDCILPSVDAPVIPAISFSQEPATITAIANDVGTDVVFQRQLIAHARPNDVAIALSTSGGSRNIIAALEEARKRGLTTVALLGYDGGEIARRGLVDSAIVVHCDYIPRIQEAQATVYHLITDGLRHR